MLNVRTEVTAGRAFRSLARLGPGLRRGTARGLNEVAFQAMRSERAQLDNRLDRPSQFTRAGVQVERAEAGLSPAAQVFIGDDCAKYLARQENDGTFGRSNAGFTRGRGSAAVVVPVSTAVQKQLGSAGRGAVRRALKLARTFASSAGVFQRPVGGGRPAALLLFRDAVQYEPRLHFKHDVSDYARPLIGRAVGRSVDREIRRAVR